MATDLPFQNNIIVPLQWQSSVAKTTIQAGSYVLSGSVGFHPWRETTTLTWILAKTDAVSLMNTLKQGMFNTVYNYTCNTRGTIQLRPTDSYSFEEKRGTQMVKVTLTVETVSA